MVRINYSIICNGLRINSCMFKTCRCTLVRCFIIKSSVNMIIRRVSRAIIKLVIILNHDLMYILSI